MNKVVVDRVCSRSFVRGWVVAIGLALALALGGHVSIPAQAASKRLTSAPTPVVSGSVYVGETLKVKPGPWKPSGVKLSYQWYRGSSKIKGATKSSYKLTSKDNGKVIKVKVTGKKSGYKSVTKTSKATSKVKVPKKLSSTPAPKITGTAKVGKTLKVKAGSWKPSGVKLSYQWYRGSSKIKGATKSSYKLTSKDKGKRIKVKVTGKKTGYKTAVRISKGTAKVRAESRWRLTTEGFGPLKFMGKVPSSLRDEFDPGWECIGPRMTHPTYGTIEVWTQDGTVNTEITGLVLVDSKARTQSGVKLGTSLSELRRLHPNLYGPVVSGWSQIDVYRQADGVGHDGSLSLYFEVVDQKVVGISLQPSILFNQLYTVSDRICGSP